MAALARCGSTMSWMAVGLKSAEEGLILALPQLRFDIARARDCMIERKGETRSCTGDKNAQQSAIEDGATARMAAIHPTKEGRRRCGAGQGNNKEEEMIGELAIVASTPPIRGQRKKCKGS